MSTKEVFRVIVDYGKTVAEMIKAGKYVWYNDDITIEHFPVKSNGQVELNIELVRCDEGMKSNDVIKDLDRRGFRPATLHELLAFGAQYPDVQRDFQIVALGSTWSNSYPYLYIPMLCCTLDLFFFYRKLDLWSSGVWFSFTRFAAVPK